MKRMCYIKIMFAAFALVFSGCQDDDINVNTEDEKRRVEFAAPAGELNYNIGDMLSDIDEESILIDENGLISITNEQEVDIDWETLVLLNDFSESWSYSLVDAPTSPSLKASHVVVFTEKVKLNHRDDVRYDSLLMEAGQMFADFQLSNGSEADVTISIPEMTENGAPFSESFYINQYSTSHQISESLANKKIECSQAQDSSYISVVTTLEFYNLEPGEVSLNFSLMDMDAQMAFGYFGQQESSKPGEELSIDVFEELEIFDEIEFKEFEIDIEITNGIGVPFKVRTENMQFFKGEDEPVGMLSIDGNPYIDIDIDAAGLADPVEETTETFFIKKDTPSNIVEIGNSYPEKMIFDVTSWSNPDGETGAQNFMGSDNILRGKMIARVPLWFKTSMFTQKDTVDFDFNDMLGEDADDAREVETFDIYFDFYSKMPLDISVSSWVIDEEGRKIGDFLDGRVDVIKAGQRDDSGYVQEAEHTEFVVSLSGDKINTFLDENAMEMVMEYEIATPSDGFVRIFEDMSFKAVVSFEAAGRMPSF